MKIIINADDLGLSRLVNDEIFSLIANGRITSSTIMANAPATEDALARLSQFPQASYGVHMNCTQFAPLTRDEALKPLLADNGEFKKDWKAARYSGAVRRAVYKEWCAQVEKIMDAAVRISHIELASPRPHGAVSLLCFEGRPTPIQYSASANHTQHFRLRGKTA